jgi:cellulose 1,4-beta-cellobiosidase
MKISTSVCTVAIASIASAKWDGKAPSPVPTPTAFATQVTHSIAGPAITQAAPVGNFFQGAKVFANGYYSSEVISLAIPSLTNKGLAAKASQVAKIPTFFWMYVYAGAPIGVTER